MKDITHIIDVAAGGNKDAADYLHFVAGAVMMADDLADETKDFATRQGWVMKLLEITFVGLPMNPFYMRNALILAPLIATIIIAWKESDKWKVSGDLKRQMFGFVRRENIDSLVIAVAAITGDMERAEQVSEMLMALHTESGETLEDWVAEGKP